MEWEAPSEPVDEKTLRDALEVVVATAHQHGVAVERDWPCRPESEPNWVVDVVRLAPDGDRERE